MSIRPAPPAGRLDPSPAQTTPVHLDSPMCWRASQPLALPRPPARPDIRNDLTLRPARIRMLSLNPPRATSNAPQEPCHRAFCDRPQPLALAAKLLLHFRP